MVNPPHVIVSPSAATRLDAVRARLQKLEPPLLIVAASRGAADEFALDLAATRGATFGVTRVSLTELVAKLAVPALARRGLTPSAPLSDDAVAARVADRVLFMDEGRIVEEGAPEILFERPTAERTQRFLAKVLHP